MAWWYLLGAIVAEVAGTLALKASDGYSRLSYAGVALIAYAAAMILLGLSLKRLPVGVAYALWSALGTAGAAVGGVCLFREHTDLRLIVGLLIIVLGVAFVAAAEGSAR